MISFTDAVLARLASIKPLDEAEMPCILRAIKDLEEKKWLVSEAASYLQWIEHVDPTISEDVALRNMRAINERVLARQGTCT